MRAEVTGGWKNLCNELQNLYSSLNFIMMIKPRKDDRQAGHIAHKMLHAYIILVGKFEGKTSLGRYGHRWEDNIIIDLKEIIWGIHTDFICLMIGVSDGLLEIQ
jgi:hypothetical protein